MPDWKSDLESYDKTVALKFRSREEFSRALDRTFSPKLRRMPLDLLGGQTIEVPAEAVPFFTGLDFEVLEDLP